MAQAFNVRLLLIERGRPIQSSVVALDFGTRCLESDDQMLGSERGSTVRTDEQPDLDD